MTIWKYEIKRKMSVLLMRGCVELCWHLITTNNCTVWLNEETPVSLHTRVVCIHLLATMLVRWVRFGHNTVNSRVIKLSSLQITGNAAMVGSESWGEETVPNNRSEDGGGRGRTLRQKAYLQVGERQQVLARAAPLAARGRRPHGLTPHPPPGVRVHRALVRGRHHLKTTVWKTWI